MDQITTSGSQPLLSICIPTYNFGDTIGATLDSIISQHVEGVEIVILDSASTDETSAVVEDRMARCSAIRYARADSRGGIDRDMDRVVRLARSEYVWLFSADDLMRPNGLQKILDLLSKDPSDVIVCRHTNCTYDMRVLDPRYPVMKGRSRKIIIKSSCDRHKYFSDAINTESLFSFISGLVVKKSMWISIDSGPPFIGSCWSHAARIMFAMKRGDLVVRYLDEILVDRRGDHDSFTTSGVVRRYALAIEGYINIVTALFGDDSIELWHTRRLLRNEFGFDMFLHAKRKCDEDPTREDWSHLTAMFNQLYADQPQAWRLVLGYKFLPPRPTLFLIALMRRARRVFA